jgi:hypothetical protein
MPDIDMQASVHWGLVVAIWQGFVRGVALASDKRSRSRCKSWGNKANRAQPRQQDAQKEGVVDENGTLSGAIDSSGELKLPQPAGYNGLHHDERYETCHSLCLRVFFWSAMSGLPTKGFVLYAACSL